MAASQSAPGPAAPLRASSRLPAGAAAAAPKRAPSTSPLAALHAAPHDALTHDARAAGLLHLAPPRAWASLSLHHGGAASNFPAWAGGALLAGAPAPRPLALLAARAAGAESLAGGGGGAALTSGAFPAWAGAGLGGAGGLAAAGGGALGASAACPAAAHPHLHARPAGGGGAAPGRAAAPAGLLAQGWAAARSLRSLPSTAQPPWAPPLALLPGGTASAPPALPAAHHTSAGVRALAAGAGAARDESGAAARLGAPAAAALLPGRLALAGAASLLHAGAAAAAPAFPGLAADAAAAWALAAHHTSAGPLLLAGGAAHWAAAGGRGGRVARCVPSRGAGAQREPILGHLGWASAFLGAHAFGAPVHNDSLAALARPWDSPADDAIQVRGRGAGRAADFCAAHAHALSAHVLALVLGKALGRARGSRFAGAKGALGFAFPCDGPGRGGSCQASAWDHVYLALPWPHNLPSALLLAAFWAPEARALRAAPDYGVHAAGAQGWLRGLLWGEASQAAQGCGGAGAAYSLAFLAAHLAWATSLMFLPSGRGYWQELAEALLWAHAKAGVVPSLSPRALSIAQGRAAGAAHFLAGGLGASWAFPFARLLA